MLTISNLVKISVRSREEINDGKSKVVPNVTWGGPTSSSKPVNDEIVRFSVDNDVEVLLDVSCGKLDTDGPAFCNISQSINLVFEIFSAMNIRMPSRTSSIAAHRNAARLGNELGDFVRRN
jgi:hypothetical protein